MYAPYEMDEITLKCGRPDVNGKDGFGFLHLYDPPLPNHVTDFERMALGTDQDWREIADIGIAAALIDIPGSSQSRVGSESAGLE
ncbi:hypothetical protein GCM10027418_27240 [Mariniluteicoccus endophyticus]